MRAFRFRRSSLVVLALLVCPASVVAQNNPFDQIAPGPRHVDVSGSTGFRLSTDWSKLVVLGSVSSATGIVEQVLVRDLVVQPGAVFDGTVTYWEGRYGFRAHSGFSRSCLAVGRSCSDLVRGTSGDSVRVRTWMYDVGGAVGLLPYRSGRWAWPYVFVGVGGVTYDLQRTVGPTLDSIIERRPVRGTDGQIVVSRERSSQLLIALDELGLETQLAVNIGIGTDVRIPLGSASVGVRLELSDHVHDSPVDVEVTTIDALGGRGTPSRVNFGLVHNLRAAAGLVVQFGR